MWNHHTQRDFGARSLRASPILAAGMCVSTLWPMFEAALRRCNASDARQQWIYNMSEGSLVTKQAFAEQPTCLMTSFAHAMRGSSVSVAICRGTRGPHWAVTAHGQLSTAGAKLLDVGDTELGARKPAASCVVRSEVRLEYVLSAKHVTRKWLSAVRQKGS